MRAPKALASHFDQKESDVRNHKSDAASTKSSESQQGFRSTRSQFQSLSHELDRVVAGGIRDPGEDKVLRKI